MNSDESLRGLVTPYLHLSRHEQEGFIRRIRNERSKPKPRPATKPRAASKSTTRAPKKDKNADKILLRLSQMERSQLLQLIQDIGVSPE